MRLGLSKESQEPLRSLAAANGYIALDTAKALGELEKLH
jgi:hypothetical protein